MTRGNERHGGTGRTIGVMGSNGLIGVGFLAPVIVGIVAGIRGFTTSGGQRAGGNRPRGAFDAVREHHASRDEFQRMRQHLASRICG